LLCWGGNLLLLVHLQPLNILLLPGLDLEVAQEAAVQVGF
jgi:hypothetical protein